MHSLLLGIALTIASAFATERPGAPADYSGRWKLDVAQSTDLPAFYSGIREHWLDVTHTEDALTVAVRVVRSNGMIDTTVFPFRFGSEVTTTTQAMTPTGSVDIPTTLRAIAAADGEVNVTIARSSPAGMPPRTFTGTETWSYRDDGALVIDREDQMPRGPEILQIKARYIFVRG